MLPVKITVVTPTRNRPEYLERMLGTLSQQTYLPEEVIVIDASDDVAHHAQLKTKFSPLNVILLTASPSVCGQRNLGIQQASCNWILLCDDDIELSSDYLEKLVSYATEHPDCGALAGRLLQLEKQGWTDQYPVKNFPELLWRFIFQLPIWGDISNAQPSFLSRPLYYLLACYYKKTGNTSTPAGWPLITQWKSPVFRTSFYSLGANLIKRDWLLKSPYDDVLDPSGIGDNYGVALGFPQVQSIHVLDTVHAYHHRAPENRLKNVLSYYRRMLALSYFMKRHNRFGIGTRLWFLWSLIGNMLGFLLQGKVALLRATAKVFVLVMMNKNPYWIGYTMHKKLIQPALDWQP